MNKSQRVSVADAARELGCSPASVREHMRRKIWHIGVATPPEKTGKKTWEFAIYRAMSVSYTHLTLPTILRV